MQFESKSLQIQLALAPLGTGAGAPEHGIAPGTKFEDLPDDFECPLCGVDKTNFAEA